MKAWAISGRVSGKFDLFQVTWRAGNNCNLLRLYTP